MRWIPGALLLAVLSPESAVAEVEVRVAAQGRVDVRATAAPLTEVLDRLARTTGMKLVQEGAPQRQPVTLVLAGRTPAEAVLEVLDGLGLNYALQMDETGTRVETLILAGAVAATGTPGAAPPSVPPTGPLRPMPPSVRAPAPAAPEAYEEASADAANEEVAEAEEEQPQVPAAAARAIRPESRPPAGTATAPVTLGPVGVAFPVSPFAPTPPAVGAAPPAEPPPAEETVDSEQ